jgi:hypothetical protein
VKQISAAADNTVFAIGLGDDVFVDRGSGFVALGGYAQQVSAGLDAAGNPEVYCIGGDNALYVNHLNGAGWASLGCYVREIAAPAFGIALPDDVAYAVGEHHAGYRDLRGHWHSLGGYLQG